MAKKPPQSRTAAEMRQLQIRLREHAAKEFATCRLILGDVMPAREQALKLREAAARASACLNYDENLDTFIELAELNGKPQTYTIDFDACGLAQE